MLSKRIIACLDVRNGAGRQGRATSKACGTPAIRPSSPQRYNEEGIDEVVILDVTATLEGRRALADTVAAVAKRIFIPLTVGGGIRSEDDAAAAIDAGAEKVSLNTAALNDPGADHDARLALRQPGRHRRDRRQVGRRPGARLRPQRPEPKPSARRSSGRKEAADRGAGEILLTSIDRDGTKKGFDCELTAAVSRAVPIPVIASGGAGSLEHFSEVFIDGCADAALAASIFHFSEHAVRDLKEMLRNRGIPVRL